MGAWCEFVSFQFFFVDDQQRGVGVANLVGDCCGELVVFDECG